MAALSGCVRWRKATDAGPQVGGPAAGRGSGGDDDDRGARLLQRQGQAGARLGAALPLVAQGLQGRAGVNRAEEFFEQLRPAPPGLSTLRAFQAAQGKTARAWKARRTGR